MQINDTIIEVIRGSVLDQGVEAIVNAANTAMRGGGGVDGAIHRAAGRGLMEELIRVAPHGAKTGTAVITGGHNLKQKHVLHTPGPVWNGGNSGEPEKLASCYRSCLDLADANHLTSLAFCSISTGIYGYPLAQAAPLAVRTVADWLRAHPDTSLSRIVFAMYQENEYQVFTEALNALRQ
ncbi:MAG: macro domain-containing protein [Armatimonadetes bacterium]|nr:macro domain-containing protein [Armatimonadota bacterium]